MSKVTKCDGCHEEKPLHLFKNTVDSGFMAYCWDCAVKWGKFTGISKIDMIRDEIDFNQKLLFFADERNAVTLSANPKLVKFNRLGYGIQEIPIFI